MKIIRSKLKIVIDVVEKETRINKNQYLMDLYYIIDSMIRNIDLLEENDNIDKELRKKILSNIPDTYCLGVEEQMDRLGIDKSIIDDYKKIYKWW